MWLERGNCAGSDTSRVRDNLLSASAKLCNFSASVPDRNTIPKTVESLQVWLCFTLHFIRTNIYISTNVIITIIIAHPRVCLMFQTRSVFQTLSLSVKSSSSSVIIRIIIIKHPLIRSLTCFLFKPDPLNARVVAAFPGRSTTWSEMGRCRTRY